VIRGTSASRVPPDRSTGRARGPREGPHARAGGVGGVSLCSLLSVWLCAPPSPPPHRRAGASASPAGSQAGMDDDDGRVTLRPTVAM